MKFSFALVRVAVCLCLARCMFIAPLGSEPEDASGGTGSTPQGGAVSGGRSPAAAGAAGEAPAAGSGGASETGGAGPAGGQDSGGEGGGAGGVGPGTLCQTNADCSRQNFDEPFRCLPDHSCVALKTPDCPVVIGDANDANATFIGGYGTNEAGVGLSRSTEAFTYQLALDEFNGEGHGGLPGGPGNARRPVVMIVCDNSPDRLQSSLLHLTDEVEVPAVLAALDTGQLLKAYELRPQTFFLSPYGGSRELSLAQDQGLIWSMLGQPSDFDAIYAALLARVETFIAAGHAPFQLKVATIQTDDGFSSELADAVLERLKFNGKSVLENRTDGNYLGRVVHVDQFASDIDQAVADIIDFQPHVIVSLANELFIVSSGILPKIEDAWGTITQDPPRPFYLLSPKNVDTIRDTVGAEIARQLKDGSSLAYQRFLAIGAAPALDRDLYNAFEVRLLNAFPSAHPEAENYYDAAYFLTYSLYAAGSVAKLSGLDVARGMQRLVHKEEQLTYDVGPADIPDVFTALGRPEVNIRLNGTLGPPDFDLSAGVRVESGSVSCFDSSGKVHYHALRYDRSSQALVGDFSPCYAGF